MQFASEWSGWSDKFKMKTEVHTIIVSSERSRDWKTWQITYDNAAWWAAVRWQRITQRISIRTVFQTVDNKLGWIFVGYNKASSIFPSFQVTISRNELPKLLKAGQWLEVKGFDSAHDRHKATDSPSANKNPDECDSSPLETWRQLFSSFTDTNMQQENMENKQITSKIQETTNDQSSESELEISDIKTDQENKSHDSISGINFKISSLTDPASEEIKNSSFATQQMEDTDNSNSFQGWMENETLEKYSLKDLLEKSDAVTETDDLNCSNDLDESIKPSKVSYI